MRLWLITVIRLKLEITKKICYICKMCTGMCILEIGHRATLVFNTFDAVIKLLLLLLLLLLPGAG